MFGALPLTDIKHKAILRLGEGNPILSHASRAVDVITRGKADG